MNRKLVAFLIPSLGGGGAERACVRLASSHRFLRFNVHIVVLDLSDSRYLDEISSNVQLVNLNAPRYWTSLMPLIRYIIDNQPAVIIGFMPLANSMALLARLLSLRPCKIIIVEQNYYSHGFGDIDYLRYLPLALLARLVYPLADAIVGVSAAILNRLKRLIGIPSNKVYYIPNPSFCESILSKSALPVPPDFPSQHSGSIVISVGRLELQKDYPTLIRAFALVKDSIDAKLIILGEGSQRKSIWRLVQSLNIEHLIYMPGFKDNPYTWIAHSDCLVLSSIYEGLPTIIIEALACGIPVVSTNCPSGPAEILDGGIYGRLVPVGDHVALAFAIKEQLSSSYDPNTLKRRARTYSLSCSSESYAALIDSLLESDC